MPLTCAALSSFLLLFLVGLVSLGGNSGCANIVPPSGGPRDSIPPQLLKAEPADSTLNFRGKEILLHFDEYIDIREAASNIIFTPTFNTNPEISAQSRTIRIRFRDTLEPNTTYVMNFGNAIVDINESNPLRDFVYTFSTGPVFDSLEISGRVILAETGGIDSTLSVILHRKLRDSAVYSERPPYVVKLNPQGAFRFRFLPSDTFAIYALSATGISRTYTSKNQLFAFYDSPVVSGVSDSVILYAYREVAPAAAPGLGGIGTLQGKISSSDRRLRFTAPPGTIDLQSDYVLTFSVPLRRFDSTRIQLTSDTVFNPVNYTVSLDTSRKLLQIRSNWKEQTNYNLVLQQDFAADTAGRELLKSDTLFFTTKKRADYGQIAIRLKNIDLQRNPVLQFVQNNQVVFSAPVKSGFFNQELFNPGDYHLRILYDDNDNGKWDPGSFYVNKKQPEIVVPVQRTITVKPAWDNEFDIAL